MVTRTGTRYRTGGRDSRRGFPTRIDHRGGCHGPTGDRVACLDVFPRIDSRAGDKRQRDRARAATRRWIGDRAADTAARSTCKLIAEPILASVGLNLSQNAPTRPVEVLEEQDSFRIGDGRQAVVAIVGIACRPAFGIGHGRQIEHRPTDGIGDARDAIGPIVVKRQLTPIGTGNGGEWFCHR